MCGSSHGLLVAGCQDKAAGLPPVDNRAPEVAGLTWGRCQDSTWEIQSALRGAYIGSREVDVRTKMSPLQDEPVKATIAPAPPGHYNLQQYPVSPYFC